MQRQKTLLSQYAIRISQSEVRKYLGLAFHPPSLFSNMPSKPEGPLGDRSLDGYIWRDNLTGSRHGTLPITVAEAATGGAFGGSASYPERHVKDQSQPTATDRTLDGIVATPFTAVSFI